jgi:predicted dienelactone hydrolase
VRVVKLLSAVIALLAASLFAAWVFTAPAGPSQLSASALRLLPGPYEVDSVERTFVDAARATPPHGEFAGAETRTLEATLWFPKDAPAAHPLVVYSHGFMSRRSEAERYARHLASYGSVVVAADYPATSFFAPGGPNIADAANQPGDVSFLIDAVLAFSEAERPFRGPIDAQRIGVAGLSLGGLTSTLAAFHPTLRDPRISAAVSIAGPSAMFAPRFFQSADVPFLMIAGDADAIVDYAANAAPLPGKLAHGGALLTLAGGSHAGFAPMSDGLMRVLGNPDRIGCWALRRALDVKPGANPFAGLGGEEQGLLTALDLPPPCARGAPREALAPGRQLMITTLALRAQFESVWERGAKARAESARFLAESLARDFSEVRYAAIPPKPPSRVRERAEAPYHPEIPRAPKPDLEQGALSVEPPIRIEAAPEAR